MDRFCVRRGRVSNTQKISPSLQTQPDADDLLRERSRTWCPLDVSGGLSVAARRESLLAKLPRLAAQARTWSGLSPRCGVARRRGQHVGRPNAPSVTGTIANGGNRARGVWRTGHTRRCHLGHHTAVPLARCVWWRTVSQLSSLSHRRLGAGLRCARRSKRGRPVSLRPLCSASLEVFAA